MIGAVKYKFNIGLASINLVLERRYGQLFENGNMKQFVLSEDGMLQTRILNVIFKIL